MSPKSDVKTIRGARYDDTKTKKSRRQIVRVVPAPEGYEIVEFWHDFRKGNVTKKKG